ncbi:hypothetical protein [Haloactinopolyspora sp.]|uniref:hypothetical protein n=1 Tax=Haloactinopolyspora sp. TaxID=1966353 RepID=UPI00261B4729|nr:hypothetical protein [Haloactinopolyspora sp.]
MLDPKTRWSPPPVLTSVALAGQALRAWTPRQVIAAAAATVAIGVVIGVVTVLIPNPFFARDIPTVPWNYPAWLASSVLTGMLVATYVRPAQPSSGDRSAEPRSAKRADRMGAAGAALAWFAVGCPVCNKIAVLALGYSGALTWFAPAQPYLGVVAIVLSAIALVVRLRGQVACSSRRGGKTTVMA